MAVYTFTARVIDQYGIVQDVKQTPFAVLDEGEDADGLERELLDTARQLERLAEEIALARFDPNHRHHHWWMP